MARAISQQPKIDESLTEIRYGDTEVLKYTPAVVNYAFSALIIPYPMCIPTYLSAPSRVGETR